MGVLIYLPERPESARNHAGIPLGAAPARAAEILFFTGIRYERHDDPVTQVTTSTATTARATTSRPVKRSIGDTPRPRRRRG
jgi:hypothetical protein